MNFPVFIDEKKRMFLVNDGVSACFKCGGATHGFMTIVCIWNYKVPSNKFLVCNNCLKNCKFSGDVVQKFSVLVIDKYVKGTVPVFFEPPSLVQSSVVGDVFSASELVCEKTLDRTRFSGRDSGLVVDDFVDVERLIREKDRELSLDELDVLLLKEIVEEKENE